MKQIISMHQMAITLSLLFWYYSQEGESCWSKSGVYGEYRVIKKSDSDGKKLVVAIGEDAHLTCKTNAPWKKCVWKPPRNGVRQLRCQFFHGQSTRISCPSFPEVQYNVDASDDDECSIIVHNIEEDHDGAWKCEFDLDLPEIGQKVAVHDQVNLVARSWRYVG
uniref:Ig-like domain-containing protein n=1 Tax=Lepeophtheirus salmonis TaxID=72036 RepID=A0A0K2T6R6_LEPSM